MAPELVNGRFRARRLMSKYNTHFPDDATVESLFVERRELLKQMFGKVGKDAYIEPPLNIDYGCNISVGDSFYSNFKSATRPAPAPIPVVVLFLQASFNLFLSLQIPSNFSCYFDLFAC